MQRTLKRELIDLKFAENGTDGRQCRWVVLVHLQAGANYVGKGFYDRWASFCCAGVERI